MATKSFDACPVIKDTSQTPTMATTQLASNIPSDDSPTSSRSSSGDLSSGKIAAVVVGTIILVGVVCLLLFCPSFLLAWLKKRLRQNRPLRSREVPLKDLPTKRPGRASGNGRRSNGADDAGSRRRRPEVVTGGNTQPRHDHAIVGRLSGAPVIINNNIYVNSTDYSQQHPAPNSPRTWDPAPPVIRVSRNARGTSGMRTFHSGPSPDGGIPPLRVPRTEQTDTSTFWDVADWARDVSPGSRERVRLPERAQDPIQGRKQSCKQERKFDIPGSFPDDEVLVERFRLVTAPARTQVPGVPTYGDNGFWVREAREYQGGRQGMDDRRGRQEREDRRERRKREERHECERRERDRLERKRHERRKREERSGSSLWSNGL